MKKTLFLSLITVLISGTLSAQSLSKESVSHWSLSVKTGLDYYRVGVETPLSAYPDSRLKPYIVNAGWILPQVSLEYTLNPYFGLGLDGGYFTYNRLGLEGNTIDVTLFASVNVANLLLPERTGFWGKVNIYTTFGGGVGFYNYDVSNPAMDGSGKSPVFVGTLNAEYNFGTSWALVGEAGYRSYVRENLGGVSTMGTDNDAATATIGLRYKFKAKSKTHIKNISVNDYYPGGGVSSNELDQAVQKILANQAKNDAVNQKTQERLKALEDSDIAIKEKLQQLEDELKKLGEKESGCVKTSFENITFEFASSKLTKGSNKVLDDIAAILAATPSWTKITIAGHTDNVGTDDFNKTLSVERATAVKNYLASKGIDGSKITVIGYGKDKPVASNATKEGRSANRRVEFEISK